MIEKDLFFQKIRKVKSPNRGTSASAGIDFFIPDELAPIEIPPFGDALIPSGIKVRIPKGFALIGFNKSGVATKKKLDVGSQVIDEDYTGEMHLHLVNTSERSITLLPGEKILQFILIPVSYANTIEISAEEYDSFGETERGSGGFGSTN